MLIYHVLSIHIYIYIYHIRISYTIYSIPYVICHPRILMSMWSLEPLTVAGLTSVRVLHNGHGSTSTLGSNRRSRDQKPSPPSVANLGILATLAILCK